MASIGDLGTGLGYFYVVAPDGTTINEGGFANTVENTRILRGLGVEAASIGLNRRGIGTITISAAPTGNGAVTAVNINGVQQMLASVNYTVATTANGLAASVATEINNLSPASGGDYIAVAVNNVIYLLAPVSSGAAVNGHAVAMVVTTNPPTFTTSAVNGGSNATTVYDQSVGFRFFLNADYDANGVPGQVTASQNSLTNAFEITDYIVFRGLQSALSNQDTTIATGVISVSRKAMLTVVSVDTEGSAATDDLEYITPSSDFANGDRIILYGKNSGRVTTITGTKNIIINGAFSTGLPQVNITLMYVNGNWYEVGRSGFGVPSDTQFRANNFPFLSNASYGETTIAPANNTTVTLTVNSSTKYQRVAGSVSLTTGNYTIALSTTGAIKGDEFVIEYDGTVIIGGFNVVIGGYTLTSNEALVGGLVFMCRYDGTNWDVTRYYDFQQYTLATANIGASQVTVAKLESSLTFEVLNFSVSFESGEQCNNRFKMPYAGTVTEVYGIVTKALAATNDGTVTMKNAAGTNMTNGVLTFAASSALETAVTATPSGNNTFVAGDILYATTAKGNAGGKVLLSIKVTRS